jgi:hypothetical protein
MINWHRLFGLTLADYFTGTGWSVEMEKDLARKRQLLDVVIIRQPGEATDLATDRSPDQPPSQPLADPCDGLEDMRAHNLMTYKSGRESLDAWAVEELIGHYVNYRKAFAATEATERFGLFAVTTRHPLALLREIDAVAVKPGVYRFRVLSHLLTLIVLRDVEPAPRNALWELFSFQAEKIIQGAKDYHWRHRDHIPILDQIYHRYRELGIDMPYTFDDFRHDLALELLEELPPEERLRGLPLEERLRGLPPEELARRLSPEDRLLGLNAEELARLRELLNAGKTGKG